MVSGLEVVERVAPAAAVPAFTVPAIYNIRQSLRRYRDRTGAQVKASRCA
jgi:hypothetical protein